MAGLAHLMLHLTARFSGSEVRPPDTRRAWLAIARYGSSSLHRSVRHVTKSFVHAAALVSTCEVADVGLEDLLIIDFGDRTQLLECLQPAVSVLDGLSNRLE